MDELTFIVGAPRSGTTWLAKIFDSHPRVVYHHEPDVVIGDGGLPRVCTDLEVERFSAAARRFVEQLLDNRTLRSLGKPPVFRKQLDTIWSHGLRAGSVLTLRAAQSLLPRRLGRRMELPRFAAPPHSLSHHVIKSVRGLGRLGLILHAVPEARIVLILRNPMGQIASRLDGIARGKFESDAMAGGQFDLRWLRTSQARRHGLTEERLGRMVPAERLAWEWSIANEKAIDDTAGNPRVRVVRLEELIERPEAWSRSLFDFAGLPWLPETATFVARSTTYTGPDRFYRVYKQSHMVPHKWRYLLSELEQQQIMTIVAQSPVHGLWPEFVRAQAETGPADVEPARALRSAFPSA